MVDAQVGGDRVGARRPLGALPLDDLGGPAPQPVAGAQEGGAVSGRAAGAGSPAPVGELIVPA